MPSPTHVTGNKTLSIVMAELSKRGYDRIFLPWGDGDVVDLMVEMRGKLQRLQCKTARLEDGCVVFALGSLHWEKKVWKPYSAKDIDAFIAYCPQTDKVYLFPHALAGVKQASLRVAPLQRNRTKGIMWAKDFELPDNVSGL
jgi:hypothetical protein